MKTFICSLCFLLSICGCTSPNEDIEADLTSGLVWSGDVTKFVVSAKEGIRLDDKTNQAGTAYLTTPFSRIYGAGWEFGIRLSFNPSANNYARFYLVSSSESLTGALEGYFLQIGGVKDNVALYRQEGDKFVLLASGRELMKGDNSPDIKVKVECDINGYWTFWTKTDEEAEYVKEKRVKDVKYQTSVCAGVFCEYTASRCTGFVFHHIQMIEGTEADVDPGEPEEPVDPEPPVDVRNMLLFNEVMYHNATDGAEYVEFYNPSDKKLSIEELCLGKLREDGTYMSKTSLINGDGTHSLEIPAKGYICFTKSAGVLVRKHKVENTTIVEISNFPALNDTGGILALVTPDGKLIDKCRFSDKMQTITSGKSWTGVSIEKRSPDLSSVNANWGSSSALTGGTPGVSNSENK